MDSIIVFCVLTSVFVCKKLYFRQRCIQKKYTRIFIFHEVIAITCNILLIDLYHLQNIFYIKNLLKWNVKWNITVKRIVNDSLRSMYLTFHLFQNYEIIYFHFILFEESERCFLSGTLDFFYFYSFLHGCI